MIVIKYQKNGAARFISHIDILRHFARTLRRAQIPVEFSQGFNPHMLIYFSPPLSLGVSSDAEYASIDARIEKSEFLARYNEAAPAGLLANRAFTVPKDPKLQGVVNCADYVLPFSPQGIEIAPDYQIRYKSKDAEVCENISGKFLGIWERDGKTAVRLASGNVNLRADRFALQLARDFNKELDVTQIVKTAQYVKRGEELINVDEYLEELETKR